MNSFPLLYLMLTVLSLIQQSCTGICFFMDWGGVIDCFHLVSHSSWISMPTDRKMTCQARSSPSLSEAYLILKKVFGFSFTYRFTA